METKKRIGAPLGNKNALGNRGGKGRAPTYRAEFVQIAVKAYQAGFTDLEVGDLLGVTQRTIQRWRLRHTDFGMASQDGKGAADERVKTSLYMRAIGYEHDDLDIRVVNGKLVKTPIRKYYPPDTPAAVFWLTNRQRESWRSKIETGVTDIEGNDVVADPMETARRIAFVLAKAAAEVPPDIKVH